MGRGHAFCWFLFAPRKRAILCVLITAVVGFFIFAMTSIRTEREDEMERKVADLQAHLGFLEAQYRGRQEDVINLQTSMLTQDLPLRFATTTFSPEVITILKNMSGYKAATGLNPLTHTAIRMPFLYQLLPHLMNDFFSLRPAYHLQGDRSFVNFVVGIPTVKRDKENYLMITISHLIAGLTKDDYDSTLIIVMIGETDIEFILKTARKIETMFTRAVDDGLIEVISPSPAYYPDFDSLPTTLGDSPKRVKWRTKQNLDVIYLMAYAQTKGTFYLMLEDDVVAKKNYIQEIRQFTAETTLSNPNWFFIEYCHVGGIGKLFRSADLNGFIIYVQLFFNNMPIDWLMESYLADRVCTVDKTSKSCAEAKEKIRPKFKSSLFQHIGLYSSLKGKIQKVKDSQYGPVPTFYPHENPKLKAIKTDIEEHLDHTLKRAYEGETFFWGTKPKKGDVIEFWFNKPTNVDRFSFRSANVDHVSDKFYQTAVEALPQNSNFTVVGWFDEFGLAEGDLNLGPLDAIRLEVNRDSKYWVILSEIDLKSTDQPD